MDSSVARPARVSADGVDVADAHAGGDAGKITDTLEKTGELEVYDSDGNPLK
jgi:hypothetical protein